MKTISGQVSENGITLIDAHHHLWDLSMRRHPWLGDHPEPNFFMGDYSGIRRDYLPADYLRDAADHNVLATVHCEAGRRPRHHARRGLAHRAVAAGPI
jgi:predicted TIM-barrel fold metal-dependent hydrolase